MKKLLILIIIIFPLMLISQEGPAKAEVTPSENDTTRYELIISEPGFDIWFATHRKPQWYYEHEYYRTYNDLYSRAWNRRLTAPEYDFPYDYPINYDKQINYGIELDYRLYWFFRFMEDKYNLDLVSFDRPGK